MKVLHIGLISCFTEGMLYQDYVLSDMNCKDGHDVTYIANTEKYVNGTLVKVDESDSILSNGLRLIRLNYDYFFNNLVTKKIQKCRRIKSYLNEIRPDTILYHGCCGYELIDVANYIKDNPGTLFYVDTHQDFNNSSTTILSKLVNRFIHGFFVKKAAPYITKFLSISLESTAYLQRMYNIPNDSIEEFPLGGIPLTEKEQDDYKSQITKEYKLDSNTILLGHSGKLSRGKKTIDLIKALSMINDERFRLIIFGSIPDGDVELVQAIKNERKVIFVGWKSDKEQHKLLGAIDLYCQPGTQSATAEMAACDGCALMLARHPSYLSLYEDNAFYAESVEEMFDLFNKISADYSTLMIMKKKSRIMAKEKLDYQKLSRLYLTKL